MSATGTLPPLSAPWSFLVPLKNYLATDVGASVVSAKPLKKSWVINAFKLGTLPYCLYLMSKFDCYDETMITYTALHGSYGILWLLKERVAADKSWQEYQTIPSTLVISVFPLGAYWLAPYLIAKKRKQVSRGRRIAATLTFTLGAAIMFGADIHKHFVLKERPGLITDGLFSWCRAPNYLGEMLIYGSFASLCAPTFDGGKEDWAPWGILAATWGLLFASNIAEKENRMSRHAGWADYAKRVACIIPGIW